MLKRTTFLASLALAVFLPQQASAFVTVVKEVGETHYVFQADNAATPEVGQPGGFKVRISTGDLERDPDLERTEPVTGLTDMLRLNLHHAASGARQTTVLAEESPGLYVVHFTPTAPGPYTYTLAALLNGTPTSIAITCVGGEDEQQQDGEPSTQEADRTPAPELLREGELRCPAALGSTLRFPPDSGGGDFTEENYKGSAPNAQLQETVDNLVVARTILYVITGVNLIMSAIFGLMLSRGVF